MADVQQVTTANFEEFTATKSVVVLDFSAEWCGPCKILTPIIHELAAEYGDEVAFGAVDVDQNRELAEKFSIMSVPSVFFFKDGQVANNLIGLQQKDKLRGIIDNLKG